MSDTDIYKNREAMPAGGKSPRKKRHRRSASRRAFDDHDRKRRSKNSGFRRFLHLARKSDNEKFFWGSMGITVVVILVLIAIWQFWIAEALVRSAEQKNEYMQYKSNIPQSADSPGKAGE